jgi:hypothetical protein
MTETQLQTGGLAVTWPLLVVGILLALAGLWGGPTPRRREADASKVKGPAPKGGDPWEVITQPIARDEELIKIPERRPWYRPGRFLRGVMTGLGAGLLVSAAIVAVSPRGAVPPSPQAATEAPKGAPATGAGGGTAAAPPAQTPPQPANVMFTVDPGDMAPTIAANLKAKGLINDDQAFLSRVAERGVDTLLKAGSFPIPTGATLDQVIDVLTA